MITKTTMLAFGLAGALVATGAIAQTEQADKDSQTFIKAAIQATSPKSMSASSRRKKGQSDAVKQYGAMLVKDHGEHKAKAEELRPSLALPRRPVRAWEKN